MRVCVIGPSGMLGKAVVIELMRHDHEIVSRKDYWVQGDVPDFIINCAGKIPEKQPSPTEMILSNAMLPHDLAESHRDVKIIHVSTDCVFDGTLQDDLSYASFETVSPTTYYAMSKALGEVVAPNVLNVRTSFIGPDHGLMRHLMRMREGESVQAWYNARWSGSTAKGVARKLVDILPVWHRGTIHLSTRNAITKADVVQKLNDAFELKLKVSWVPEPHINRSLTPDVVLPPFKNELEELTRDYWSLRACRA